MTAPTKIREKVRLSECGENDYVRLPAPIGLCGHVVRTKTTPGGNVQMKYRQSSRGNVRKIDVKGDPLVERERVPVSEDDFAQLAVLKEQHARRLCMNKGLRPDGMDAEGRANWTLFTEEGLEETRRREYEAHVEAGRARRAEILEMMPLTPDEVMQTYVDAGILPCAATDVVRRMAESSPVFASLASTGIWPKR